VPKLDHGGVEVGAVKPGLVGGHVEAGGGEATELPVDKGGETD